MPRTKAPKKGNSGIPIDEIEQALDDEMTKKLNDITVILEAEKLNIPAHYMKMILGELKSLPRDWNGKSIFNASALAASQILDATKTMTVKRNPKRLKRSTSFVNDDGYLTAESSNGASGSGQRQSRTRTKIPKSSKSSRSLSNHSKVGPDSVLKKYKTPVVKIPPAYYGFVTPKVKPNTPQVVIRRAKQGEMALSLQGSPLLTGSVVTEETANVNIPLQDGRLLSIQPQRGLRVSQIPQLDEETRRQLQTLRDNLSQVCAAVSKK